MPVDIATADEDAKTTAPAHAPAVVRALRLLERLAAHRRPLSASALATDLGLPRSSVHGLCATLHHHGYLRRSGEGGYAIGPQVMVLAESFIAGTNVAQEFADLWTETRLAPDESVILAVLNGADAVYVAVRNSPRPLGIAFNVGVRLPAWISGSGKAMLAFLPPEVTARLFAELPAATGPADLPALRDELARIRARGWSVDDEGVRAGVLSFGAPILDAAGRVVAGVSMCLNKSTLDAAALERHRAALLDIAARLTRRLGGSRPSDATTAVDPA